MTPKLLPIVLIIMGFRTLAAPFSSGPRSMQVPVVPAPGDRIKSDDPSVTEVPIGYFPTLPVLQLTVFPSSQAAQTVTITEAAYTVTETSSPETVVTTVIPSTTVPLGSSSSSVATSRPNVANPSGSPSHLNEWTMPTQFNSIDEAFNIEHYAFGRDNVQLSSVTQVNDDTFEDSLNFGKGATVLKVIYPRGSYSPSHAPRGGTDFYAAPTFSRTSEIEEKFTSLRNANNVTLSYSVFFPATFDFVKGGKLPGLYGGHERCSGGDDGFGCFSTRLMWRAGGKGELYLYAPKDQQPPSLCSTPPRSICDSAYGLSIGRGSFTFERGMWTYVSQTVWLNTPGRANGGFILQVAKDDDRTSMKTVMSSTEVFYRATGDDPGYFESASIGDMYSEDDEPTGNKYDSQVDWNPVENILSGESVVANSNLGSTSREDAQATVFIVEGTRTVTAPNYETITITRTLDDAPTASTTRESVSALNTRDEPAVGFIGIFFSTFFGGSTPDWASTKDQSACFKDFKVVVNGQRMTAPR